MDLTGSPNAEKTKVNTGQRRNWAAYHLLTAEAQMLEEENCWVATGPSLTAVAYCLCRRGWRKAAGTAAVDPECSPSDIKEGKTRTPSALFAKSHSKNDPQSRKVFIDDRSKALWEKYEAFRVECGVEEGTQEAEKLYYESKKSTIYDLGTSATMFYEKPTASTPSTGSTYIPSAYSKLQSDLRSTQQQLDEQKKLVDDQRRQFDEVMKLIHSLQSQVNMLSCSSSHPSESHD
ncbi:hypothetical protein Cgig2_016582 [Carnegiea gigantea]|uniref:Uncharacterized protein n=1 Tax=Carnegiea gigantea TaxID=171969 RepID=A0A9Q1L067_9CARY|nr:hypothetical protein Cgig2_016582 [Carnegiea gigantea]